MRAAAHGLAQRGHRTWWLGPGADQAPEVEPVRDLATVVRAHQPVDLVIGDVSQPWPTAWTAWRLGARLRVLSLEGAPAARFSWWLRWGLESVKTTTIGPAGSPGFEWPGARPPDAAWSTEPVPNPPDAAHPDTEALERAGERGLALDVGGPRAAAFLDRDGTLVLEKHHLSDPRELELVPGAVPGLALLHAAGYALIVVSNQSGVGRGYFTLARAHEVMARLRRALRVHGVELDAVYLCPHAPDAGCACRKPGRALFDAAARNMNLVLRRSAMFGDKLIDVEAGHAAGGFGVLVRTGYGGAEEARAGELARPPDRIANDLESAAAWFVERGAARE